ncbi:fungal class II heme-containing peroxidase [Ancistrocladus abbreviatus]
MTMPKLFNIYWVFLFFSFIDVSSGENAASSSIKENPLTAKASLIRYWNRQISNKLPKPCFLLSKASPLNAVDSAIFRKLASQHALSTQLPTFCSSANLFCNFESQQITSHTHKPHQDADFASYSNKQFLNYGLSRMRGIDSFKNYSIGVNMPTNSFARYSPGSTGHNEQFTGYSTNANAGDDIFSNYDQGAAGGSGEFMNYQPNVNVPKLRFTSYDSSGNHHKLSFATYTDDANSGSQSFISYGKNGNGEPVEFTNYAATSNIVGSTFNGYGELAKGANNSFKTYSSNANNPNNNFKSYGVGMNSGVSSFENYRDGSNVGADTFQFYSRDSDSAKASFSNYGKSFNEGTDTFKEYGRGSTDRDIQFKSYGVNNSFKGYGDNKGVNFSGYIKGSSTLVENPSTVTSVNMLVEEGKFFREAMLKPGTVIKMPDIRDKMPRRSFLPRSISSKLPFSTSKLGELKDIFHAESNSTIEHVMVNALAECERAPSRGETKKCVGSIEDMIDFAVSVLGHDVVVRTTENVNGSDQRVMIGSVRGINRGEVTKSVSCHQSLFPYLLYYCHSVPKVRVYEADILDSESKAKINDGVAICHVDTSAWSAGHGAFVALGSGPGLIEVCHWIFENDMTWTTAD